ncbi:MAG: DCC1-like thiol-disulfide oxidoreductase family protein, partial [Bacteroidota bacterium]
GVCNLCNSSVLFVIKRDDKDKFLFAPLQSEIGVQIISKFNIDTTKIDSILTYDPNNDDIKYKSSAALKIASNMRFPYPLMAIFYIIPPFLRNVVYDFIAKNRYKWFGKKEACMIPTPELRAKFLE